MSDLVSAYHWLDDDGPAFGGPGLEPRWTSSRKNAVVTAYSASSRVWFTTSHGTLNEIYFPTIDKPQTRDMELLFTDESTFVHEEKRDFRYDFNYVDPDAPAVRVNATAPGGLYKVTKEFISDPHHPVVLVNVKIDAAPEVLAKLKCYALLAPHVDGGGHGNSARSIQVAGQRSLLAWKNNVSLAFGADCGFSRTSCGYVGSSDGVPGSAEERQDDLAVWPGLERQPRHDGRDRVPPRPGVYPCDCAGRRPPRRARGHDADALDAVCPAFQALYRAVASGGVACTPGSCFERWRDG